jgi:hypothetical protein
MLAMRKVCLILMSFVAAGSVCLAAQDRTPPDVGAVSGSVRYASGQAIADVRVSLIIPRDRYPWTTRTAADGSYQFNVIPAGAYQMSVSHAGSVARRVTVTPGSVTNGVNFSIPDGSSRRVVIARVVMNEASRDRQPPARIGVGVRWSEGTVAVPLPPGDNRLVLRLPSGYFLDSATHGPATVYSMTIEGKRPSAAAFFITVPPEPAPIPELVVTLGASR